MKFLAELIEAILHVSSIFITAIVTVLWLMFLIGDDPSQPATPTILLFILTIVGFKIVSFFDHRSKKHDT